MTDARKQQELYQDMAFQLLDITFDTAEWDDNTLTETIEDVAKQIEELKPFRSVFDSRTYLYDLLIEAYKTNHFEE